ncbi:MAG: alpha/beta hydrolase [Clostridium sp.]
MNNSRMEEGLNRVPLILKTIKYNIITNRNIKAKSFKYGNDIKQYYKVFNEENKAKPIIFFVHGGGWWHGSPKMCTCIGKYFSKRGYTVVMPAYRLFPLHKYPSQLEDVYACLHHYIKASENCNNKKIILMGFSAGGELAANLALNTKYQRKLNIDKSIFKGLVTFSGVLNFETCISKHSKILINNYLGDDTEENDANPINLIDENINIPVLCIHGERDSLINKENSISFIEKVNSFKNIGCVEVIKGKHHSDINELIMGNGTFDSRFVLEFLKQIENY